MEVKTVKYQMECQIISLIYYNNGIGPFNKIYFTI